MGLRDDVADYVSVVGGAEVARDPVPLETSPQNAGRQEQTP